MIFYENSGNGYNNFVSSTRFSSLHVYLQKYNKYNTYMLCRFTVRAGFPVDVNGSKRRLRLGRAVLSPPLSSRTPAQPDSTITFGPDSAQPWESMRSFIQLVCSHTRNVGTWNVCGCHFSGDTHTGTQKATMEPWATKNCLPANPKTGFKTAYVMDNSKRYIYI